MIVGDDLEEAVLLDVAVVPEDVFVTELAEKTDLVFWG